MLEKDNANDINHGHEETKAECDDQDCLLLRGKTHLRQDRDGKEQNGQVGDDVDWGGGQVERDDVDAL